MTQQGRILTYIPLTASAFLGAWLIGLIGKEEQGDLSGFQMLMSFLGFFIFVAALVGIIYLIGQQRRSPSQRETTAWEILRRKGRHIYIQRATLMGLLLGFVSSSLMLFFTTENRSFGAQQLGILIFLVLIIGFACYYAAVRTWEANEKDYLAMSGQQPQPKLSDGVVDKDI
jgi:Na+/melibiose symporter-like transporter